MKLTKTKLKQIIKEELKETFGAESAVDPRTAVERIADQFDASLEAWKTSSQRTGETVRMQRIFTSIAQDLRRTIDAGKEEDSFHLGPGAPGVELEPDAAGEWVRKRT